MSYPTWGYASGFVIEYINTNIKNKNTKKKKSKKAKHPDKKPIRDEKKAALYAEKAKASKKERDIRARERKKAFEENNLRSLKISTAVSQSKKTVSKHVSAGDRVILRDEVGDLYSTPVVGKNSPFLGKAVGEKIFIKSYECTIVSTDNAKYKKQSMLQSKDSKKHYESTERNVE